MRVFIDTETEWVERTPEKNLNNLEVYFTGILVGNDLKPGFLSPKDLVETVESLRLRLRNDDPERDTMTILVGFNINRFDIPLLNRLTNDYRIQKWLTIDLMPIMLPLRNWFFIGNSLENALEWFNLPTEAYGTKEQLKEWCRTRNLSELKKHCEADLKMTRRLHDKLRYLQWPPRSS